MLAHCHSVGFDAGISRSVDMNPTCRLTFKGKLYTHFLQLSKIEKVPRGIRDEKSSKDMASSWNLVSTIGAQTSPTMGNGTRCPEGYSFPAGMPHPLQILHGKYS